MGSNLPHLENRCRKLYRGSSLYQLSHRSSYSSHFIPYSKSFFVPNDKNVLPEDTTGFSCHTFQHLSNTLPGLEPAAYLWHLSGPLKSDTLPTGLSGYTQTGVIMFTLFCRSDWEEYSVPLDSNLPYPGDHSQSLYSGSSLSQLSHRSCFLRTSVHLLFSTIDP